MNQINRLIWIVLACVVCWPAAVFADEPDKSGVKPQVINLPSGPGSIQGLGESFEPTLNTGTASYGIPLVAPPGAGGHAPELSLTYDGGSGNGPFGLGWRLSIPYVQRQTDKGLPQYIDADLIIHSSGEELVPLDNSTYRFKVEKDFTRFTRSGDGWVATERNGKRWFLGETGEGRQTNPLGTFCWMPQRFVDTNDNEVRFFYQHHDGQIYLSEIRYNVDRSIAYGQEPADAGVRITIEYKDRPDPLIDYRSRSRVRTAWLASAIEVSAQGQRVRRYEFDYEQRTGGSLLTEVRFLGRDLVRWEDDPTQGIPPLRLDYSTFNPQRAVNVSMRQPPLLNLDNPDVDLVDINGDALPDLLYTDPRDLHRFYINRGDGRWAIAPVYPANSPTALIGNTGVQLADVDGDGLADFLVKTGATATGDFYYYPNRGGNAWEVDDEVTFNFNPDFTYEDSDVWLVDLDQDKRIDVLRAANTAYYVYFNGPDGWAASPDRVLAPLNFGTVLVAGDPRVQLADMNGDRMQDIVFIQDKQVVYFPAAGFGNFDEENVVIMTNSPSFGGRPEEARLADINGDGLTDLLRVNRFSVSVWLNQAATGFGPEIVLTDVPEYIAGKTELRLADMNGDGATDLLYSNYPAAAEDIFRYVSFNGNVLPNLLTTIDNGLGRVITLSYRTSTDYYVDDWNAGAQWTQRSPVPVPVVSRSVVKDKLSSQEYVTEYAYRNAYYDGEEKTFRGFALAQQTDHGDESAPTQVQQLIFDTGFTDESRKGMILQQDIVAEGGSCGPDEAAVALMLQTNQDVAWDATEVTSAKPAVRSASALPVNCYNRTLNQIETRTLADATDGRAAAFSYIRQIDIFDYETTTTPRRKQQVFLYDDYGNTIQKFDYGEVAVDGSNPALGNDERLAYSTFIINQTAWIIDRVFQIRKTDLDGNFVSEERFYYDGPGFVGLPLGRLTKGNLTRQESNLGPLAKNHWVQSKRYRYDAYGNQTGIMDANGALSANGQPDDSGHWTEVIFDATFHIYPVAEIIHLGGGRTLQMTASYDLGFGVITESTDFNGHQTEFVYDSLARVSAIIEPGDTQDLPTQIFSYALGGKVSSITTDSREQFGTANTYRSATYVDGLGRTLQTRSEGEDGQVVVDEATTYNLRAEAREKYLPYYAATSTLAYAPPETEQPKVFVTYDPLLRQVKAINPDGTYTHTHYLPWEQVLYDEEDTNPSSPHADTPATHRFDGLGRLIQVLERNGADTYVTFYGYDLLDNLTSITDAAGNVKRQAFDGLSRKLWMDDPNSGLTSYTYDDVGNVIQSVDAKGQRITYAYDGANRVISENFVLTQGDTTPDFIYHYDMDLSPEYPEAQNTQGYLAWIEDQSSREYLSYDARGNVIGRIKRVRLPDSSDSIDFVMLMQYDAMDRLVKIIYPDGTEVIHQYNSQSLLEAIPGYVEDINYIASGQRSSITTAAGVTTSYSYDDRLRLTRLRSLRDSVPLQNWSYQFDGASNILHIDDLRPDRTPTDDDTRTFTLDDLYRLTSVQYKAGAKDSIAYAYDPIGNLIRKTSTIPTANLGDMKYGQSAGPHALTQVGNKSWTYDANGNLSAKPDFNYTWDYRNRLVSASNNGGLVQSHTYDYNDRRITKRINTTEGNSTVLYPDKYVEVRGEQLIKYIFADDERVAEIRSPYKKYELIRGFNGKPGQTEPLYGFDADQSGYVSAEEIAARGGSPDKVEFDEIDDALSLFFDHIESDDPPLNFAVISAALENYRNYEQPIQQNGTTFYHLDHLGSSSVLVDENGNIIERNAYLPFGSDRVDGRNSQVAYRFTGQEEDVHTGLYYYKARFYDPAVSRFISVDPFYLKNPQTGLKQPQELNVYSYSLNNPVKYVDPNGLQPTAKTVFHPVKMKTYQVTGKSLQAVARKIEAREWAGLTQIRPILSLKWDRTGKVIDARVDVRITMTLPKWKMPTDLKPEAKAEWNRFMRALGDVHEQRHVEIAREHFRGSASKLLGKTEREAKGEWNRIVRDHQQAQDAFDDPPSAKNPTGTDHGRMAPGADSTIINVNAGN